MISYIDIKLTKDVELYLKFRRYKQVHLCANYILKLYILKYSFPAYHKCRATCKSYLLQIGIFFYNICFDLIYSNIFLFGQTKNADLPPQVTCSEKSQKT